MRKYTRRVTTVGATVAIVAGAGVAFAAWTTDGTGTGHASAASAVNLDVDAGTAAGLYPTGMVEVPFTVHNPNPYAVRLVSAGAATNFSVDAQHSGCNVSSLSGAAQISLGGEVIPAHQTSVQPHNVVISMDNNAADACQGAAFEFSFTVHGASS